MNYQDYLNNWAQNYGDANTGEYGYWKGNRHFPYRVHRLTESEFARHVAALDAAQTEINEAMAGNDDEAIRAAFNKSLPHELELLL